MAEGPYVLGADYGTESVRVGIFDREDSSVALASREYGLRQPLARLPGRLPTGSSTLS